MVARRTLNIEEDIAMELAAQFYLDLVAATSPLLSSKMEQKLLNVALNQKVETDEELYQLFSVISKIISPDEVLHIVSRVVELIKQVEAIDHNPNKGLVKLNQEAEEALLHEPKPEPTQRQAVAHPQEMVILSNPKMEALLVLGPECVPAQKTEALSPQDAQPIKVPISLRPTYRLVEHMRGECGDDKTKIYQILCNDSCRSLKKLILQSAELKLEPPGDISASRLSLPSEIKNIVPGETLAQMKEAISKLPQIAVSQAAKLFGFPSRDRAYLVKLLERRVIGAVSSEIEDPMWLLFLADFRELRRDSDHFRAWGAKSEHYISHHEWRPIIERDTIPPMFAQEMLIAHMLKHRGLI